ncbi:hypothetical protein AALA00_09335 [Lachnospiraceae bacterium 46-15]
MARIVGIGHQDFEDVQKNVEYEYDSFAKNVLIGDEQRTVRV